MMLTMMKMPHIDLIVRRRGGETKAIMMTMIMTMTMLTMMIVPHIDLIGRRRRGETKATRRHRTGWSLLGLQLIVILIV